MAMIHKERAKAALECRIPDHVPTFDLEFQLAEEMFGKPLVPPKMRLYERYKLSPKEKERLIYQNAEYIAYVYRQLDYSIIPLNNAGDWMYNGHFTDNFPIFLKALREFTADNEVMFTNHGDGTFAISDGNEMYGFAYRIADDPDGLKAQARLMANAAIKHNKRQAELGIEVLVLYSDYCFTSGPFLSPKMFGEFIQPYLYDIIKSAHENGQYAIKHTDGNIMPILEQMAECHPHGFHSLDPMAGVDIREVKRLIGDRFCLYGNVNCALMLTGTAEEVIDSAKYCLTYGKENGGYFFCTSNVPFKGMPPERYQLVLDIWKQISNHMHSTQESMCQVFTICSNVSMLLFISRNY